MSLDLADLQSFKCDVVLQQFDGRFMQASGSVFITTDYGLIE